MPDFLTIQRQHEKAKAKGFLPADSSIADFARLGAEATGDPSYQQVAESPAWKNMIRGWSANVDEAIQSGPVDDWTAEAFGWVGDKFGVTPEASRAAGRELPRQVANFVPAAVGGAVGFALGGPPGAAVGGKAGLALTSGLSAFDAYGKSGKVSDAIIGGIAPVVGGKLSEFGSKAALRSAATPGSFLNKLGFMAGADVANPATHTIIDAVTGLPKQVLGETVSRFRDKALGYAAGETLANVGFTGLDIAQQGPDAVLNKDYLFANLASNIPFMAADIPNFTKTRFAWEPTDAPLKPTQAQINAEKTRGERTRESLEAIDSSLAKFQKEAELGVDIGRFIDKNNQVAATMEGHRKSITLAAEEFKTKWDKYRQANTALPDVLTGIDPKALLNNASVMSFTPAKTLVQEYAQKLKQINKVKGGNLSRIAKSDADLDTVMGLVEEDLKLPDTLLSTPVEQRTVEQYQKALGTKLSDNAVKLIRMKHMEFAQGENFVPEFPKLWEEHNKALTTGFEGSIDDRYELITASLLAKGKFPKVVKAQKKAVKKAAAEGLTKVEAAKEVTQTLAAEAKVDPLKAAVAARVAAAKAAVEPIVPAAEKPKVGRPAGPTPETQRKADLMEQRIELAGKALNPTDDDRFFLIASNFLSPENRTSGLSYLFKVAGRDSKLPLEKRLAIFTSGVKTLERRKVQDDPLKFGLKEELTPDPVEATVAELGADNFDSENVDLNAIAEAEEAIRNQQKLKAAEVEVTIEKLIVEETARELDDEDVPEITIKPEDKVLVSRFLSDLAKKMGAEVTPQEAWTRYANMRPSERAKNLELAKLWKAGNFQLAAKDIDPLTVQLVTGQPLPIKEFATAWARETGVPENEIPATVDDFVRITQMFAAGEARFGKLEGIADGMQFAKNFRPAVKLGERVVEAPTHLQAWEKLFGKTFDKFGPAETAQMKDSVLKEGFVTEAGFKNRKDALVEFKAKGGRMNLTPGEKRDWLDSSDMQFARASAGAFDFGMREVKNGQIQRPGKPPLGTKDGWMSELDFRNNGGDINGVLSKDEVAFYKQLVPEAFAGEKVHLQKLWDGLGKVGEQVRTVVYGQEAKVSEAKLELDKLTHDWWDVQSSPVRARLNRYGQMFDRPEVTDFAVVKESLVDELGLVEGEKAFRLLELRAKVASEPKDTNPRATSYYNQISPFDTKKYPVMRVDVSLPLKDNLERLALSMRQDAAERQAGLLWKQDDLHENLPNTLGWAMVQYVPHPVTGEKVMFVAEQQSRWGQEIQKRKAAHKEDVKANPSRYLTDDQRWQARMKGGHITDHPLLPIQHSLILKSLIKEAQKQGVTKIVLSDGETAMMTEGHDKQGLSHEARLNIPVEEFVARLNKADPALKATVEKEGNISHISADDQGNPIDFLRVENGVLSSYALGDWPDVLQNNEKAFGIETIVKPISQDKGMRLHYDTTLPSVMRKLTGSEGEKVDMGVHKNAQVKETFDDFRQREALNGPDENGQGMKTVGSPVFRNADGTPKTSVTGTIYDISSPSDRVNTLFAKGGTIYGAAFKNIAQAFFSTKAFQGPNKTKAMGYVLAHEMGHIAFGKAMRGEYGPETKQMFDEAIAWVKGNDPVVLRDVEEIIRELYLPKEMKNLDGVRDVLGNLDPEEWMANAHAMMVTGAAQANKPIKALLLLPKPIRTVVENTIRRVQDALKHARMYWKLSGDKNKLGQVLRVKEMVDSVRQKFREAEWQTAQAMEFLDVNPASLLNKMENVQFARSPYPVEGVKQTLGNFFNNATQGLGGFMATYRSFIEPGFRLLNSGNAVTEQVSESLTPIFGHKGATDNIVVDKSLPWFKLANSKPLYDLTKRINLEAQDSKVSAIVQNPGGTVSFNWLAMSPEHRAEVKLYNPDQQKAMAQFLMQKEQSTRITQKHNVEHETNKARMFAVNLVTRIKSFDQGAEPALRHKEARVVAEKLFDAMQSGDPVAMKEAMARFADPKEAQKLVDIIQERQSKLASLAKFYADQPNFQSLRRFKPIIQRYTDTNGESKVLDFNKGSEALAMRKELEAKGWKAVGEPITRDFDKKYKSEFTVDSKVVDLLESKEGRLKDLIDSMDIDPADRDALLGESSFLADVLREAKSNDIYLPGVRRRISGGPEHLDMLEQHLTYTQAAHKVGYMTALGEELKYHMNNPELKDQLREKTQFMEFYKQAKESDPKFWRIVNKANAVWHIGFNLPGHLAELFQPLQTHIHEAVYQGHSMLTALRTTVGAEKSAAGVIAKLIKSKIGYHDDAAIWENWPDKDEAAMLKVNWRRSLTQPLQEVYQQVGVNQETLRGIVQDREMLSPSKILTKPLNMYSNAAMGLYSVFTQHNNLVGLLTGYRLAKKKGLSHDEAVKSAALFELTANNSGGRTERPVYFGKLGSAGYMVYALSSYVRGRFTDLARYYRHGFDKVNFPELDQSDRRAARQAFASMIAGQLAAAGILGFPFVGAGIALMEDLTGDEIKGQGLKALNEMTDDPLLTQALSYGVMSSMAESLGIPADLHSRFALGGFMGVNAYDGISAASVLGPTASMVNSMWKMGKALVQEKDLGAAFRAGGPGVIKRMSEALSQEFQAENPDANLPMAMAGFRSGAMFKNKEMERIISKTNEAAQNDIKLAAKKVEESLMLGPDIAQKTLMREANLLIDQRLEGRGRQVALKDMMSNLRQRIALQKVKEQMPSDIRGKATAQTAGRISDIAQAVGYQPPPAGNVEQEQIMRSIYQQLGGWRSQGSMRRARERQMELEAQPGMFY